MQPLVKNVSQVVAVGERDPVHLPIFDQFSTECDVRDDALEVVRVRAVTDPPLRCL